MKKLIAVAAALVVSSAAVFALDITAGARGNFNMGVGTTLDDSMDSLFSGWDNKGGNMGAGFAVYANFGLLDLGVGTLGVQPEFGMNFNNGYNAKEGDASINLRDTTIDIPVLVTFTTPIMDSLSIGGGIGPYLSIPFGLDMIMKSSGYEISFAESYNVEFKAKMNFGLAFDVNAAYSLGPGSIVFDVRYMMDLTPTKVSTVSGGYESDPEEMLTRRMLTLGVGYQMKF